MADGLKITGSKSAFDELVSSAGAFTANDSGSAAHLRFILLEAKDGRLTVTAESNSGAIQFEGEGFIIENDGQLLIRHNMLSVALSTIQPTENPVLEFDASTEKLTLTAGVTEIHIVTAPIGKNAILPSIGSVERKNGVTLAPEKFIDWYNALSPFRSVVTGASSTPTAGGVHVDMMKDRNALRGVAFDGKSAASVRPLEAKIVGNGIERFIFEHEGVSRATSFIKKGSELDLFYDPETRRVHLIVNSKDGEKYHIWVPVLNVDVTRFPADAIVDKFSQQAKNIAVTVEMKKGDLLQLMRNGSSIGSLSPEAVDGASRNLNVSIWEDTFLVSVGKHTSASYESRVDASVQPLDAEIHTAFSYGTYGSMIEAYNNEDDPELIKFGVVQSGERYIAIIMFFDEIFNAETGGISDSVMLIPLNARTE